MRSYWVANWCRPKGWIQAGLPRSRRCYRDYQSKDRVFPCAAFNVDPPAYKSSVIALHGLDAQSPKTWVAWRIETDRNSGDVFWLGDEDMLPSSLPEARILTYDWNANYDNNASEDIFLNHADSLLRQLHVDREYRVRYLDGLQHQQKA